MVDLTLPDASPAPDTGDASGRLVARVQAWQHRHPLARRLPAADVTGLGVIGLPYGPADAGGQPQPLFHQPSLVPGLSHRALVVFAQRHAVNYRPGPAEWPQRDVERADASPEPAPETRYLLTAAVTEPVAPGALPRRLLIAPEGSAIWGARPLSRPRVLAAAGVLLVLLGAAGWALRAQWPGRVPAPTGSVPAASAVAVASAVMTAASPASAAVPTRVVASAVTPTHVPAASAPASQPWPVPRPAASAPAQPVSTPAVRAVPAVPAAMPASAPKAPAPASPAASVPNAPSPASAVPISPPKLLPMPSLRGGASVSAPVAAPAPTPAASVALPAGPHFALVSLPSKKRAGAEATLAQIHKLLGPAIGQLQAQIMPSPEGFVVTIWPLPTQADAERLAEVLARRGVPMKWLEF